MNNRELKKLLADTIKLEDELYNFCIACLVKIYGDDAELPIAYFKDGIDSFEDDGCIAGLCCIEAQVKSYNERQKQWQEEHKQEKQ